MRRALLVVVLVLVPISSALAASDDSDVKIAPPDDPVWESLKSCSACSLRHQSFFRNKAFKEKQRCAEQVAASNRSENDGATVVSKDSAAACPAADQDLVN